MENDLFKPILEDSEHFITTKKVLDSIEPFDSALYIIGTVKTFDSDDKKRIVNKATQQTSTVFNFSLEGKEGLPIHVCCWKENMHLLEGKILVKNVLFIDGPFARPVKSAYSLDDRRFQLTIRPNTRVYVLRTSEPAKALLPALEEVTFYKNIEILSLKHEDEKIPVGLDVWLKQSLRMTNATLAAGVVRDKEHFVKLLVTGFTPNVDTNPKVGDKIKLVAFASYAENGSLVLEGKYDKIKLLGDDNKLYMKLEAAASPGKGIKVEKVL